MPFGQKIEKYKSHLVTLHTGNHVVTKSFSARLDRRHLGRIGGRRRLRDHPLCPLEVLPQEESTTAATATTTTDKQE